MNPLDEIATGVYRHLFESAPSKNRDEILAAIKQACLEYAAIETVRLTNELSPAREEIRMHNAWVQDMNQKLFVRNERITFLEQQLDLTTQTWEQEVSRLKEQLAATTKRAEKAELVSKRSGCLMEEVERLRKRMLENNQTTTPQLVDFDYLRERIEEIEQNQCSCGTNPEGYCESCSNYEDIEQTMRRLEREFVELQKDKERLVELIVLIQKRFGLNFDGHLNSCNKRYFHGGYACTCGQAEFRTVIDAAMGKETLFPNTQVSTHVKTYPLI